MGTCKNEGPRSAGLHYEPGIGRVGPRHFESGFGWWNVMYAEARYGVLGAELTSCASSNDNSFADRKTGDTAARPASDSMSSKTRSSASEAAREDGADEVESESG